MNNPHTTKQELIGDQSYSKGVNAKTEFIIGRIFLIYKIYQDEYRCIFVLYLRRYQGKSWKCTELVVIFLHQYSAWRFVHSSTKWFSHGSRRWLSCPPATIKQLDTHTWTNEPQCPDIACYMANPQWQQPSFNLCL